mmetsp:Transcript_14741/g.41077  ORF Transcript_14741/g.41077 Transcript_14741/m.41077 type:complete len:202 (+) Transcript_14741:191-796(+)
MKWIKIRLAVEQARENAHCYHFPIKSHPDPMAEPGHQIPTTSPFRVVECPDLHSVIFRNGGVAWDHPGNVKFRAILTLRERERDLQKTMAQKSSFLDGIIKEIWSHGLTFLSYDETNEWYEEIREYGVLRKKVFQALRDQSARRKRLERNGNRKKNVASCQMGDSSTSLFMQLDHRSPFKDRSSKFKRPKKGGFMDCFTWE